MRQLSRRGVVLSSSREEWVQLYTGKRFYVFEPRIEDIDIVDIAHALSNLCRFGGHCMKFYSVAQHSVLLSQLVSQENALYGLLHDSAEAYLGDVISNIKHAEEFSFYRQCEQNIMNKICEAFKLPDVEPVEVKQVDRKMLATEARDMMLNRGRGWREMPEPFDFHIVPWEQEYAKTKFISRFHELTRKS